MFCKHEFIERPQTIQERPSLVNAFCRVWSSVQLAVAMPNYFAQNRINPVTRVTCAHKTILARPNFPTAMTVLLTLVDAHKSYGDQVLLDGAEMTLTDEHKFGFIGRNGA